MAITLQIEVTESGLHAARDEIQAFLVHESARTHEAAHLSYVVLRRLLIQTDRAIERQGKEAAAKVERLKPKPVPIRYVRRAA